MLLTSPHTPFIARANAAALGVTDAEVVLCTQTDESFCAW